MNNTENCLENLSNNANKLFDDFPMGILMTLEDNVIYYNNIFSELFEIEDSFSFQEAFEQRNLHNLIDYKGKANKFFELKLIKRNNSPLWIEATMNVESGFDQPLYKIYTLKDITREKNAQEKNRESNKQFKAIFEDSKEPILLHNSREVTLVNSAFMSLFGFRSRNEVIGNSFINFFDKSEHKRIEKYVKERNEGTDYHDSYISIGRRKDGSTFDMEVNVSHYSSNGEMISVATLTDISNKLQIEKDIIESNNKLKKSLLAMISTIVQTMESRDPFTAGHQKNVAKICEAIGIELGYSSFKLEGLVMGARIHDIGKLNVPLDILQKKDDLTGDEQELIREHTAIGLKMLEEVEFPWPIKDIVANHHERLDSSGYPNGLKADEIIEEVRIVMVADVYEAMISERPYRNAYEREEVMKEIVSNKARLYDEKVVEALVKVIDREAISINN